MLELRGKKISDQIAEEIAKTELKKQPNLVIVRVGNRPDDISYETSAAKKLERFGISVQKATFDQEITSDAFVKEIQRLNDNASVDGILILRPLPERLENGKIENVISPQKDMDGISPENMAAVFAGKQEGYAPCTAQAVIELLKGYEIPLKGTNVVIVGRSLVVGKPLAMLFLIENATVTVCHSKTRELKSICSQADILVAATGRAKMIDESYLKEDAVVVDVGINIDENGTLCGDCDWDSIQKKAKAATPVPGGVGAVTTAVLGKHVCLAAQEK